MNITKNCYSANHGYFLNNDLIILHNTFRLNPGLSVYKVKTEPSLKFKIQNFNNFSIQNVLFQLPTNSRKAFFISKIIIMQSNKALKFIESDIFLFDACQELLVKDLELMASFLFLIISFFERIVHLRVRLILYIFILFFFITYRGGFNFAVVY